MKERNGSLDLLKCLCMLFVVIIHLMGHSGYLAALNKGTMVYYGANYMLSLIRVAVPIFVLITGYFGVSFKLEKVVTMEITLLFYSLFTFIIALVFAGGGIEHTITSALKTILPFSYKSWWFATNYIVLLFFAPYINTLLQSIEQKRHISLIVMCFILFNVISSFSLDPIDTTSGYGFVNLIFLYLIGRYIRMYGLFENIRAYQWLWGYCFLMVCCMLIDYVWKRVFGKMNKKITMAVCENTHRIWNKVILLLMS